MTPTSIFMLIVLVSATGLGVDNDPLLMPDLQIEQSDLSIKDAERSREIPIRFDLPAAKMAAPTAFWDTYLRNDEAARQWLNGDDVRSVLEDGDQWQKK